MPSINLYAISKAELSDEIKDLAKEFENSSSSKLNLYKLTEEMAVVFLNNIDPCNDTTTIPYKMLFGNSTLLYYEYPEIGGFMPTSQIASIIEWIEQHKIENFDEFSKMYDSISIECKNYLDDIGAIGKEDLYFFYIKPMVDFYYKAYKNNNSILFCAE